MGTKRMRVFAGPNGSGKTTIVNKLRSIVPFGIYVNADDIEKTLRLSQKLSLDLYSISPTKEEVESFFKNSNFSPIKRNEPELYKHITVDSNFLVFSCNIDSYLASDVADFIRYKLLEVNESFTFETVMTHEGKIDFMRIARENGYRVYLYYIATEDPEINVTRVNLRVAQHGHYVPSDIIRKRYYKSLSNLKEAIKHTNRAYLFDNSDVASYLCCEITESKNATLINEYIPAWLIKSLFE